MDSKKIDCEFCVDWADSNTKMLDSSGNVLEAGTALLICNNIIFLHPLTVPQLLELRSVVAAAVQHELDKRM
jgi:hypothetical protein